MQVELHHLGMSPHWAPQYLDCCILNININIRYYFHFGRKVGSAPQQNPGAASAAPRHAPNMKWIEHRFCSYQEEHRIHRTTTLGCLHMIVILLSFLWSMSAFRLCANIIYTHTLATPDDGRSGIKTTAEVWPRSTGARNCVCTGLDWEASGFPLVEGILRSYGCIYFPYSLGRLGGTKSFPTKSFQPHDHQWEP